MLSQSIGIVLKTIKYGETSLIVQLFSEQLGLHSYMLKGIRKTKSATATANLFYPGSILQLQLEHKPQRHLQVIKEFQCAYIYQELQSDIAKHALLIYAVELLLKTLPEQETMDLLFQYTHQQFIAIDQKSLTELLYFPLYFTITCGQFLGYNILGAYSTNTPFADPIQGSFSATAPNIEPYLTHEESCLLNQLILQCNNASSINLNIDKHTRNKLLDWYLIFLKSHHTSVGQMKSLPVLRSILS